MVSHVEVAVGVAEGGIEARPPAPERWGRAILGRPAEWRAWETVSSGFSALDGLLPAGGVRRGSLIDWWAAGGADGAATVACAVACRLATPRPGGRAVGGSLSGAMTSASTIVVVDRGGRFYPPAVLPWLASRSVATSGGTGAGGPENGPEIVPEMVVVRPSRDDDELWAIDQALRCPGVAAVLAWPGRMQANAMRRLQLAARASGAVGLLVRGLSDARTQAIMREPTMREPTWADARVVVAPMPPVGGQSLPCPAERRLRLSLVGGPWQGETMLEDRSVDISLDLSIGREATSRLQPRVSKVRPRAEREVRACRAS